MNLKVSKPVASFERQAILPNLLFVTKFSSIHWFFFTTISIFKSIYPNWSMVIKQNTQQEERWFKFLVISLMSRQSWIIIILNSFIFCYNCLKRWNSSKLTFDITNWFFSRYLPFKNLTNLSRRKSHTKRRQKNIFRFIKVFSCGQKSEKH